MSEHSIEEKEKEKEPTQQKEQGTEEEEREEDAPIVDAVVKPEDPLDARDFSAVDYLNELFPTPESLSRLDEAIGRLDVVVRRLDAEIGAAVREQALNMARGRAELREARDAVGALAATIGAIRDKADASEQKVTDICGHIRSLDHAKRNLTVALRTLRDVQQYARCVERLGADLAARRYRAAAAGFRAAGELARAFAAHTDVRQIAQLAQCVRAARQSAETVVYESFRPAADARLPPADYAASLCELVDALGADGREKFVAWFCGARLERYTAHFGAYAEDSGLDHIAQRFDWFRTSAAALAEAYAGVFPEAWDMPARYAEEFCSTTRLALCTLLDPAHQRDLSVTSVVMALRATLDFEKELTERYDSSSDDDDDEDNDVDDDKDKNDSDEEEEEEEEEIYDTATGKMVPVRRGANSSKKGKKVKLAPKPKKFKGAISGVFKQQLELLYVPQEERNIGDMLERAMKDERWTVDEAAPNKVLGSCTDLIYYMKTTMTRCVELSTGTPLLELHKIIRAYLRRYCELLRQRLPPETKTPLTEDDIRLVCVVVNTADFCRSRAEQFQRSFRKCTDGSPDAITFQPEVGFIKKSVINAGVRLLTRLLMRQCEPAFTEMARTNWVAPRDTDNVSPYVSVVQDAVTENVPLVRKWLAAGVPGAPSRFFELFCDQFVTAFAAAHLETLYRCKRLSSTGVRVLSMNFSCFKRMLMNLPNLGAGDAASSSVAGDDIASSVVVPSVGFSSPTISAAAALAAGTTTAAAAAAAARRTQKAATRWGVFVNTALRKSEVLIVVSMYPPEALVANYFEIVKGQGGSDALGTVDDFRHILELQDLSKSEKARILEQFQIEYARHTDPSASSPVPSSSSSSSSSSTITPVSPPSPSAPSPDTPPSPSLSPSAAASAVSAASQKLLNKIAGTFH